MSDNYDGPALADEIIKLRADLATERAANKTLLQGPTVTELRAEIQTLKQDVSHWKHEAGQFRAQTAETQAKLALAIEALERSRYWFPNPWEIDHTLDSAEQRDKRRADYDFVDKVLAGQPLPDTSQLERVIQWVEDHVIGFSYNPEPCEVGVKASTLIRMMLKERAEKPSDTSALIEQGDIHWSAGYRTGIEEAARYLETANTNLNHGTGWAALVRKLIHTEKEPNNG